MHFKFALREFFLLQCCMSSAVTNSLRLPEIFLSIPHVWAQQQIANALNVDSIEYSLKNGVLFELPHFKLEKTIIWSGFLYSMCERVLKIFHKKINKNVKAHTKCCALFITFEVYMIKVKCASRWTKLRNICEKKIMSNSHSLPRLHSHFYLKLINLENSLSMRRRELWKCI